MIDNVISELIDKTIVRVDKRPDGGNMLIYLYDSMELFTTLKYDGYLRMTKGSRFDLEQAQMTRNTYKLVLFLDKKTCEKDILNIIANIDTKKQLENVFKIKVSDYYLDSWDNILKEMNKDKSYTKYKVIVIDIESEEIICKEKIKCN